MAYGEGMTRIAAVSGVLPPHRYDQGVVGEGIALPLVHTAWLTAGAFPLLDLPLLVARIRCENAAPARAGAVS